MTASRKSGGCDIAFYQAPDTITQFEHIRPILTRDLQQSNPEGPIPASGEELSLFIHALQQFQEDALGINRALTTDDSAAAAVRIPAKVFPRGNAEAITANAPVYNVLLAAYKYRQTQGWTEWDFSNPANSTPYIQLIAHIRDALVSTGIVKNPSIAFADSVSPEERASLSVSIRMLGGTVVEDHQQASHIVHVMSEKRDHSDDGEWLRTLEVKGDKVFIHHWYYPDSYDEWVADPSGDFADPEPIPEHQGPWNISTRWVKDSVKYSEWMNEEDYDSNNSKTNEQGSETFAPFSQRYRSKRDNSDQVESDPKRIKRSSSESLMDTDENKDKSAEPVKSSSGDANMEETTTATAASTQEQEGTLAADVDTMEVDAEAEAETEPKTEDATAKEIEPKELSVTEQESNRGSAPPETEEALSQAEAERFQLEEEAGRYLSRQTQEVIIPSYAAWFNLAKIHEIEHKSLPEFFNLKNRSKTPTVYKDYRDFMINTYRLNPSEYLTVTACRRNLAGDVCAIIRVHAFLEQWGLINYQVDPDTRPSTVGPAFTGHFRVTADTPRGLQPFLPSVAAPTAAQANGELRVATASAPKAEANMELRRNIFSNNAAAAPTATTKEGEEQHPDKKQRFNCFTCGTDCTKMRYHSVKTKNFELCSNCYLEGRFPSTMSSGDFIRLNAQHFKHATDDTWTDQETLLLLEGLEMYDEDWNLVAEHVGTRSREQCILHFLQLPIEDPYLGASSERELGPLQYHRIPFSQADNPVMSVVAFLASVVNPGVAAAAAKSALKELAQAKKAVEGESTEGAQTEKAGKTAPVENGDAEPKAEAQPGEMDVDKAAGEDKDTEMKQDGEASTDIAGLPRSTLERVGAAALGSAAAKAKVLADNEEREVRRLVTQVVEAQLKKMELKLQQFEELESVLETEKRELERQRQQLYLDRLAMKKSIMSMQEKFQLARQTANPQAIANVTVPPGGVTGTGTTFQNEATVRQQQEQGQGVGPLTRDQNAEGVVVMPLP
ncbi:hypothetical protein BG015_000176 [Linnemannia schmuckeri]|uniref:Uncharacterized protein n=1 Tax=Linnemannia schmuckeri TaxID=64567 RepID=A0A9P5V7S4_9FUNG|nr:hypothetical protein BG015_000176 [Linnemannia schmuckeri]